MILIFAVLTAIIALESINNFIIVRDSTEAANHVAVQFKEEVLVINGVQDQLFQVSDSFHDYFISKDDGDKNKLLKQMEIFDRKLESAQKGHFTLKSERKMLQGARIQWNEAKRLIVYVIIRSQNDERFSVKMNEAVDDHIQKVNGRLEDLSEAVNLDMLELHERTREKDRRAFYFI